MAKMKSRAFKDLVKSLSADPKVKAAIDKARLDTSGDGTYVATSAMDLLIYLLKFSGAFVGKKKAEKLAEFLGYVSFFVTVSLIVKLTGASPAASRAPGQLA